MSGDAADAEVIIRVEGHAGRITLNRPKALNALTYDMVGPIADALASWRDDPAVAHVLIDSAGDKAFCAGGDIQKLYDTGRAGDYDYGRMFWRDEYRLNADIANFPKPYIALMDGIVMGGGVGLSAHGSHRIVTETSMIAMPEVSIGFLPDVGGTYLLSRAPGSLGEYLGLTAARMNAADALYAGFADIFVPAAKLGELTETLTKEPIDCLQSFAADAGVSDLKTRQDEIDGVFGKPDIEAIQAALGAVDNDWARTAEKAFARNAPLSVAAALTAIRQARAFDRLEDCLSLEYRFVYRSMQHADFLEGIRAAIIDKDRSPNWRIPHHNQVGRGDVQALLAPLGQDELVWPA